MKLSVLSRVGKLPPRLLIQKAGAKVAAPLHRRLVRRQASRWIGGPHPETLSPGKASLGFTPLLPPQPDPVTLKLLVAEALPKEAMVQLSSNACAHRFNLLGSGLVEVNYHTSALGCAGFRYKMAPGSAAAEQARAAMVRALGLYRDTLTPQDEGRGALLERMERYVPIDWHLDFRSGYRWNPADWYRDIPVGLTPGADIKVPWELSRFQHLGVMGLAWRLEREQDTAVEFVLQLTDWIVSNPPGCGVNWRCAMEVAIRAVNWLWGLSLFDDNPALTGEFRRLLNWSLARHALHLRRNLENTDLFVGNHFLANLAGMIYLETACPWRPRSDHRLVFAAAGLLEEMKRQVHPDGTNFESSTGYHRLAAEIFYSCALLLLRLDSARKERLQRLTRRSELDFAGSLIFPSWFWEKALCMAEYAVAVTKPDGSVPQLGDFDNGRLHKLVPVVVRDRDSGEYREEPRDFRHLAAVAGAIFSRDDLLAAAGSSRAEGELLAGFLPMEVKNKLAKITSVRTEESGSLKHTRVSAIIKPIIDPTVYTSINLELRRLGIKPGNPAAGAVPDYFPDSGVAVFRYSQFHTVISCGPNGAEGHGVHAHNDKLSFELNFRGSDFIVDPGSYLYTARVDQRNAFRSTAAHNTVVLPGAEQNSWSPGLDGLFVLPDRSRAQILETGPGYLRGRHAGYGAVHEREFFFLERAVLIADRLEGERSYILAFNLHPDVSVQPAGHGCYLLNNGFQPLYLCVECDRASIESRIVEGFYAPSYGIKLSASRLLFSVNM